MIALRCNGCQIDARPDDVIETPGHGIVICRGEICKVSANERKMDTDLAKRNYFCYIVGGNFISTAKIERFAITNGLLNAPAKLLLFAPEWTCDLV
jgi:hypothetical protein